MKFSTTFAGSYLGTDEIAAKDGGIFVKQLAVNISKLLESGAIAELEINELHGDTPEEMTMVIRLNGGAGRNNELDAIALEEVEDEP